MKKMLSILLVLVVALTAVFASGAQEVESSSNVTKLTYACPGKSARYNFVDEKGELQGYEIDIIREVDRRLEDVEIELIYTGEFSALFPGLESGQFDIIGGGISWKPERAENYLFSEVPYLHSPTVIGVRLDDDSVKSIDDLAGKNIAHIPGTAQAMWIEAYNEANPAKKINIDYVDASSIEIMQMVYTGRYDACIHAAVDFAIAKDTLGVELKIVEIENADEIQRPDSYYLYAKGNTELQQKIDACLKEIRDDGTMSEFCKKWFSGMDLVERD